LQQPKAGLLAVALGSDVAEQGAVKQNGSRDSDKATGWAARGLNPGCGKKFTPSSLLFSGYRSSFSGVNLPERHVKQVKNEWRYTSAYPMCLHDVDGDSFTFAVSIFATCIY